MSEPRRCRLKLARYGAPRRACCGAVAVEFALVFVIFFSLFYAIVAYGMVLALQQALTMAAEEGARAVVQDSPDDATRIARANAMAKGLLMSWLPEKGITVNTARVACPEGSVTAETRCMLVEVSYNYAANPIVPSLPLLGIKIPATLGAKATVQYVQF